MAKQFVRHGRRSGPSDQAVVDNPEMNDVDKAKLKDTEEAPMQAEVKYIDKKHNSNGQVYYAETVTVKETVTGQINWWQNFSLCLVRHMDSLK